MRVIEVLQHKDLKTEFHSNKTRPKDDLVRTHTQPWLPTASKRQPLTFLGFIIHIPNNTSSGLFVYMDFQMINLLCPHPATFCCPHLREIWMCLQYENQHGNMLVYRRTTTETSRKNNRKPIYPHKTRRRTETSSKNILFLPWHGVRAILIE